MLHSRSGQRVPAPDVYGRCKCPTKKLFAQARDELFSHINRCGVLTATDEDKTVWMGRDHRLSRRALPRVGAARSLRAALRRDTVFASLLSTTCRPRRPLQILRLRIPKRRSCPGRSPSRKGDSLDEQTAASTGGAENTPDEGDDAKRSLSASKRSSRAVMERRGTVVSRRFSL